MQQFIDHSRYLLIDDLFPRIEVCVRKLPEDKLWWRPNQQSNSIGNLLLHLAGNLRQWVVDGVGGIPYARNRKAEFSTDGAIDASVLVQNLREACTETGEVLSELDPERLLEPRVIQGMEVTVMSAIYHALEHFSGHLGQIIYITKMLTGEDLRFWIVGEDGSAQRGWLSRA